MQENTVLYSHGLAKSTDIFYSVAWSCAIPATRVASMLFAKSGIKAINTMLPNGVPLFICTTFI